MNSSRKELYFIHGALMHPEQMAACCAAPEVVTVARLKDFELSFYGYSPRWDGGEEAVVASPGGEVWGVVYSLSELDAQRLDSVLGVREDGGGIHFHFPADVLNVEGEPLSVLFHRRNSLGPVRLPSTEHLQVLAEGARLRGLPLAYVAHLQARPSCKASFQVPRQTLFNPLQITALGCDACH